MKAKIKTLKTKRVAVVELTEIEANTLMMALADQEIGRAYCPDTWTQLCGDLKALLAQMEQGR